MHDKVHVFTSITSNYLPKARVLAESVHKVAPQVQFHLVLSDTLPVGIELATEPFDNIIYAEQLVTDNFFQWAFGHSVVELCTAVKGVAVEFIFEQYGAEQVFYFDPDMVVFDRLDELSARLAQQSIVLTPHLTDPDQTDIGIMDNEMSCLLHGVFNLGFLGVNNVPEGRRFSGWWAQRLLSYCHDDLPRGLFTDQKWVDLAPCFFDDVAILRSPAFNVATWNIANRKATGSLEEGILINDEPLGFYHFSGFDSGDQITMLERYGTDSPILHELRAWYIAECERNGQSSLGKLPCKYSTFSNGDTIANEHRLLYRQRVDLQRAFPNPYLVQGVDCYKAWYDAHPTEHLPTGTITVEPRASMSAIFVDLARHCNARLVAGHGRGRLKRLALMVWIRMLYFLGAVSR